MFKGFYLHHSHFWCKIVDASDLRFMVQVSEELETSTNLNSDLQENLKQSLEKVEAKGKKPPPGAWGRGIIYSLQYIVYSIHPWIDILKDFIQSLFDHTTY